MPAHRPARGRLVRGEEGLRRGRLRRLHRPSRRRAGPFLPRPGLPRRGRRGHDHRGPVRPCRPGDSPAPTHPVQAPSSPPRASVRLLHPRHGDDRRRPGPGTAPGSRRRPQGQLCRCTGYGAIRDAIAGIARVEAPDGACVGRSVRPRPRRWVVTGTARFTFDIPEGGMLHLKVLRSPHAHPGSCRIDTGPARAVPGVVPVLTHEDAPPAPLLHRAPRGPARRPPTRWCSIPSCASPPARRGGGRRDRGRRRGGLPGPSRHLRGSARPARLPPAPSPHRTRPASRRVQPRGGGARRGRRRGRRTRRGGSRLRGDLRLAAVQHAHLETHGCAGWRDADGPPHPAHQHAGAVPDPRRPLRPVRSAPRGGPRHMCGRSAAASAASRRC